MPVFDVTTARPRQELSLAIVEGEGTIPNLIYKTLLPEFPINRRTAHLIKATLQNSLGLRHIASAKYLRAPGALFERAVAKFEDDTLTVALRGMEIVIPNEVNMDYDEFLDVEQFFASRFGQEISGLTKEFLAQAAIFNPANTFSGAATNSGAPYLIGNIATLDFVGDVIASTRRLKALGEPPPYTMVIPGVIYEVVRRATSTLQFVAGSLQPTYTITTDKLQNALSEFGISQILLGDQYFNTAADGAAPNLVPMWPKTYVWIGRPGMAQAGGNKAGVSVPQLGGVGFTAYWEGFTPGGIPSTDKDTMTFEGGNYVESYPAIDRDSMVLRLKMSALPYVGNKRAADLIATQA